MSARICTFVVFLTLTASLTLDAQDTTAAGPVLKMPSTPTAVELTRLLSETTTGQHDPFLVLPRVASLGDNVISALRGFLFATPIVKVAVFDSTGAVKDSVIAPPPNRVYGVLTLDLIGTPSAYQVLGDVVRLDTIGEVRGAALRAFAMNCYSRVQQGSLLPDKEVVHLLLGSMDDTTFVRGCSMAMGTIARQGLKNWTGTDYGEILPDTLKAKDEKTLGMSLDQYREQWWQQNSATMQWNSNAGSFVQAKPKQ
jgi:hypothetical protein